MVLGAITLEHFAQFFQSIAQQEGSAVALMRQDGMLLAGYPRSDHIGQVIRVAAGMSRTKIVNARHVESPVDRQIWILSARPLAGYPLVVAVSQTEESALRSWRRFADHSTSMTLLRIFVVLLMGLAASRWWQKQRSLTRELTLQNLRFDAALDNMGEGLCMFDAEKRLVVCNDRYAKLYRLPPELLEVGTPHGAIIAHRVAHGILKGETSDGAVKQKISALRQLPADATSSRIDELADGRLICVTRQPMAGGGWVATHVDVTEQRRSEAKIIHMAQHDALTDLPNRVLLARAVGARSRRHAAGGSLPGGAHARPRPFQRDQRYARTPCGRHLLKAVAERLRACAQRGALRSPVWEATSSPLSRMWQTQPSKPPLSPREFKGR